MVHHAFESPADFTQDTALAEGLREFLLRGGACSGRKSKKRKKACALWKTEAETLFSLYPANRGANPSLERFGRYAELAQILAEQVPAAALRVLREAGCCDDDLSAILLAASVLRSNSFTIMDAVAVGNIGSAVSLRASFFNHECHANAKVRAGAPLSVRAIAPIAEGEEIFISYLGPWRREHERQVTLTPSHLLDRISPIPPRFSPFFARFHRLAEPVPTSRKPEPRAKKQWQGGPNAVSTVGLTPGVRNAWAGRPAEVLGLQCPM